MVYYISYTILGKGWCTILKTAIVTDTNSGITVEQAEKMGVSLIPMPFSIDGTTYLEGKDCTQPMFFERMQNDAEIFTSQPAPGDILPLWETLLQKHDRILHIPMTAALSSSYQTAAALAKEFGGRVLVVNDGRISATQLQSLRNAQWLLEHGVTPEGVQHILESEKTSAKIYFAVNTMRYLKKSGRVTAAAAAMASVLNIKPVLQVQDGQLDAFKKVRGMKQGKKILISALRHDLDTQFSGMKMRLFAACSGTDEALGRAWQAEVQAEFPEWQVELVPIPLGICCYIGENALGIACAKAYA